MEQCRCPRPTESCEGKEDKVDLCRRGKTAEEHRRDTSLHLVRRKNRPHSASHFNLLTEAHLSGILHYSWLTNYYATRDGERTMAPRQTDKRDRLIQTAVYLVHQQGFHQTTLADIAQQAHVPLGTVYYFFKTKEAIGEALVEHYLRIYRGACQQWNSEPDPKARLEAFIRVMLGDGQRLSESGCPIGTLCAELHKQGGPLAQQA